MASAFTNERPTACRLDDLGAGEPRLRPRHQVDSARPRSAASHRAQEQRRPAAVESDLANLRLAPGRVARSLCRSGQCAVMSERPQFRRYVGTKPTPVPKPPRFERPKPEDFEPAEPDPGFGWLRTY